MIVNGLVCFWSAPAGAGRRCWRSWRAAATSACWRRRAITGFVVTSGDVQTAPAGSLLPRPLAVAVRDAAGQPVRGAVVVFRVTKGAASGAAVLDSLAVTNDLGEAVADLRLGSRPDTVELLAFPLAPSRGRCVSRPSPSGGPTLTGVLPVNVGPGDTLALAGSLLGGVGAVVEIGGARLTPVSGGARRAAGGRARLPAGREPARCAC